MVVRMPFTVVAKPTGAACNLDCTYCFFLSKELLYDVKRQTMTLQVAHRYIDAHLRDHPDGEVPLVWQGGEPTLRGVEFFRDVFAYAASQARTGQRVHHCLQTNATLIDDEWARLLAEYDVLVGVSCDGPQRLHDVYRLNKGGRGTFDAVERGWECLQRHGVQTNVLCTVHAANESSALEVYRFFTRQWDARYIQFIPIVERVDAERAAQVRDGWRVTGSKRVLYTQSGRGVTERSVSPRGWGSFLSSVFDEWVTHDVGRVSVQHFDMMVNKLFGVETVCSHAARCGNALAIEFNGDIYSCDHYVEPGYRLGNVASMGFAQALNDERQRRFGEDKTYLTAQCLRCPVRVFCQGGCPKDRFVDVGESVREDGRPGPLLNYLCTGYRDFFTHAMPDVLALGALLKSGVDPSAILDQRIRNRLRSAYV